MRRGEAEIAEAPLRPAERRSHGWRRPGSQRGRMPSMERFWTAKRPAGRGAGMRRVKSSHPDQSYEKKTLSQEIQRLFFVEWSVEMELKTKFTNRQDCRFAQLSGAKLPVGRRTGRLP